MATMRLKGKIVHISGAGSGIGRAGARIFSREGAKIVLSDNNFETVEIVRKEISAAGGEAFAIRGDVSSSEDNDAIVQLAMDKFGGLDIVWANAGITQKQNPIDAIGVEEFDRLMAVNTRGPWLACRSALEVLKGRTGAAILFTASLGGLKGRPNLSAYQASKGATVMMTRALARELAPFGIRVNSICPVLTETQMLSEFVNGTRTGDISATDQHELEAAIPLGRLARPEDIAYAALFLASDEASFITGVNLPVDGGSLS